MRRAFTCVEARILGRPRATSAPPDAACRGFSPSIRARPRRAPSLFDERARAVGRRPARAAAALPRLRLGRARPRGHLARHARHGTRGHRRCAARERPRHHRASASPTSARPRSSGSAPAAAPIHRAIVWQDRRTAAATASSSRATRRRGAGARPRRACCSIPTSPAPRSPGSSTTCPARARAPSGASSPSAPSTAFLLWRLTGGRVHATDVTNASRTLLYDIHAQDWDDGAARTCCASRAPLLPEVRDSSARLRHTAAGLLRTRPADRRHRRRPAGGAHRSGVLRARHGEVHLRHGLLPAAQHRQTGRGFAQPHAHDARLPHRRAHAPTPWRARSSSPARPSSGCATACKVIGSAAETAALAARVPDEHGDIPGAGIRRVSAPRTGSRTRAA